MKLLRHHWLCSLLLLGGLFPLTNQAEPLAWTASRGEQTLHLFGTIHVGQPEFYPLPQAVSRAFRASQAVIVEADLNGSFSLPAANKSFTADKLLSDKQKQILISIAQSLSLSPSALLAMEPWQAALSLQQLQFQSLGYDAQYGIDQHFITKAKMANKPIWGLESIEFQISLTSDLPNKGLELLTELIEEWDQQPEQVACLVTSWVHGDETNLAEISQKDLLGEELYRTFVTERNQDWVKQFTSNPNWQSGSYFVAVGALHLVGKDNVPQLLEQLGYTVTPLTQGSRTECAFDS
ncbi:TraB/GumN family protein [Vibrio hippocampi]|uniref:TraB/GumN family protein n=1 Tax=Vibrio hippocampi TaxID=654686 RepID=A0ABM8ZG46_9VIBR|nr:TraB/GumN family protein [Vibrio hippocampi]CAH0525093.1 hypothetical protein VHP8226_00759 [Vibrio hippocampi]